MTVLADIEEHQSLALNSAHQIVQVPPARFKLFKSRVGITTWLAFRPRIPVALLRLKCSVFVM